MTKQSGCFRSSRRNSAVHFSYIKLNSFGNKVSIQNRKIFGPMKFEINLKFFLIPKQHFEILRCSGRNCQEHMFPSWWCHRSIFPISFQSTPKSTFDRLDQDVARLRGKNFNVVKNQYSMRWIRHTNFIGFWLLVLLLTRNSMVGTCRTIVLARVQRATEAAIHENIVLKKETSSVHSAIFMVSSHMSEFLKMASENSSWMAHERTVPIRFTPTATICSVCGS